MINPGGSCLFIGDKSVGDGTAVKCTSAGIKAGYGDDLRQSPLGNDPRTPLLNLSIVREKMDTLQRFLSESVEKNALIGKDQMDMVSTEISSAIHQIIVNGTALLACSQQRNLGSQAGEGRVPTALKDLDQLDIRALTSSPISGIGSDLRYPIAGNDLMSSLATPKAAESVDLRSRWTCSVVENLAKSTDSLSHMDRSVSDKASNRSYLRIPISSLDSNQVDPKLEVEEEEMEDETSDVAESEIVELDAVELLAEHIHFCEICGKGFKRDANLRMHMRAHGDQFKTPEALAKPDTTSRSRRQRTRFSCPFVGCNRNKSHTKFRPLKTAICVKNHFKRIHCPKMFACDRCNKKSFSVVADLKSHLKHCGESKWLCSCGTSFSRKDKLFGHMAIFEGHMPAVAKDDEKPKGSVTVVEEEETQLQGQAASTNYSDHGFYDSLFEGLGGIEGDCSKDVLEYPCLDTVMDEFYQFQ